MESVKDLIQRMADDALIIGHRNSEWTGIGPMLEEDISFSSMAQDKIGHAQALYNILHEQFNMEVPDFIAFRRNASDFKSCQFVELPIGDYAFTLVRHYLFDHAESFRYNYLSNSTFLPLKSLATKFKGEIKYHTLHADIWMKSLTLNGNEESKLRIQSAVDELLPYAMGMFELGNYESDLIVNGIFVGELALQNKWHSFITESLNSFNIKVPVIKDGEIKLGGRRGYHLTELENLINEMTEVIRTDYTTEW